MIEAIKIAAAVFLAGLAVGILNIEYSIWRFKKLLPKYLPVAPSDIILKEVEKP